MYIEATAADQRTTLLAGLWQDAHFVSTKQFIARILIECHHTTTTCVLRIVTATITVLPAEDVVNIKPPPPPLAGAVSIVLRMTFMI